MSKDSVKRLSKSEKEHPAFCSGPSAPGSGTDLALNGEAFSELLSAVLERGKSLDFRAKGGSMSPFIRDGDIITVSPMQGSSPGAGDIVACRCPNTQRLLIHRIVKKRGDLYLIQGDNVPHPDGEVGRGEIIGRVTRILRMGKPLSFGLGQEKFLIVFLVRSGILNRIVRPLWRLIRKQGPMSDE